MSAALVGGYFGFMVWLAVYFTMDDGVSERATASVTLGLTDAVVWPFYDPVRERMALSVDEELQESVRARVGDPTAETVAAVPAAQAIVVISATGASPEIAVEAADWAAELVLERSGLAQVVSLEEEAELLSAEMAVVERDLSASQDQLDALLQQRGVLDETEAVAIRSLEDDIAVVSRDRNNWQQQLFDLERELESISRQEVVLEPLADVVSRVPPETAQSSRSQRLALASALGLASSLVVASLAFTALRRRAPIVSAEHLSATFGDVEVKAWDSASVIGLSKWLIDRFGPQEFLGLAGVDDVGSWAHRLTRQLYDLAPNEALPELVPLSMRGTTVDDLMLCRYAVVIVAKGTPIPEIRRTISWLADCGIWVDALLFVGDVAYDRDGGAGGSRSRFGAGRGRRRRSSEPRSEGHSTEEALYWHEEPARRVGPE